MDQYQSEPQLAAPNRTLMKEVVFRTPIMLGTDIPEGYSECQKVVYKKDSLLHDQDVPQICQSLENGIVIDLPTTNISDYITRFLAWLPLSSDEQLVDHLHRIIMSSKPEQRIEDQSLKSMNLLQTPLFQTLDSSTQSAIIGAMNSANSEENEGFDRRYAKQRAPTLDALIHSKIPQGKREMKQFAKEEQAMFLKYTEKLKPAQIAKKLKMTVEEVYKIDKKLKLNFKKSKEQQVVSDGAIGNVAPMRRFT